MNSNHEITQILLHQCQNGLLRFLFFLFQFSVRADGHYFLLIFVLCSVLFLKGCVMPVCCVIPS